MKILILGQPRCGKTTLALKISNLYNIEIIHTDKIRRELNYHCPHKGFSTEIETEKQNDFYNKLLNIVKDKKSWIIEGMAINPKDRNVFNADIAILLGRPGLNFNQMFIETRKYDNDWISRREDEYLLKLFKEYKHFEKEWIDENEDIFIDTTNYQKGLECAIEKIKKYNI